METPVSHSLWMNAALVGLVVLSVLMERGGLWVLQRRTLVSSRLHNAVEATRHRPEARLATGRRVEEDCRGLLILTVFLKTNAPNLVSCRWHHWYAQTSPHQGISERFRAQAIHDYLLTMRNDQTRSESLVSRMDRTGRRAVLFRASRLGSLNSTRRKRPNALWRALPAQRGTAVFRFYYPILQTILQGGVAS